MSKQCTLFRAWGGKSSSAHTTDPCSSTGTTSGKGEAYAFDDFDKFDEFFHDDVTEELVQVCDYPTAEQKEAGPSRVPFHSPLNASVIEDIPGFDVEAGQISIYPTNYPIRDYQFNIVQKALFKNTLVCLPTGLGKTFIAAVVMYNFYRWYPSGKIIFLAPTKPLVTQQIEACYNVMGIPQSDAAEMTGNLPPRDRNQQWQSRRVFFLTPQVMQNDLARGACPAEDVCCVVFDEAHKALGNHAYCQVVKELAGAGSQFRVLALSATPGNDLKAVQQVVTNLQIGQIELRSEDSFDIQRYVHERRVEKFVVPFEGEILEVKTAFLKVLSGVVSRLARLGLLYHSNADRMSKYQILQARDQYRMSPPPGAAGVHVGVIEGDFALSISLYHAYELLLQHGMRSFYQFLSHTFSGGQSRAKMEVMRSPEFGRIMRTLQEKLGQGSVPDNPGTMRPSKHGTGDGTSSHFFYSHPKLIKLEEVVLGHFRKFQEQSSSSAVNPGGPVNTRVMIFSQYRESVQEIADMLSQHIPLVRVMSFVGHSGKSSSKGLTQKEQTEVVRRFREGGYNTLVATCVGEEGLDIGEVDLIVCFDAHKSPIRLVQRMGRTGRKRSGRIVVIVSEGKEEQIYLKSQSNKNSIHRAIRDGCRSLQFYHNGPRMVPRHIHPTVHKMHMSIDAYIDPRAGKKGRAVRGQGRQSRLSFGPTRRDPKGVYLTDNELDYWSRNFALPDRDSKAIEKAVERCVSQTDPFLSIAELNKQPSKKETSLYSSHSTSFTTNTSLNCSTSHSKYSLSLSRWIHWQTAPTSHRVVCDSLRTNQLTSSLEFMDLLHSGEGIGRSYELEMGTFLNPDDVKMDWQGRRGNPVEDSEGQQEAGGCVGEKRRARKRQRIFDSSEDEDFQPPASKSASSATDAANNAVVLVDEGSSSSRVGSETWERSAREGSEVVVVGEESCPPGGNVLRDSKSPPTCNDVDMGSNLHNNDRDCLTTSKCVIPKAPSTDSLDWLDALEPSQVSSSTPKATSVPKRSRVRSENTFQFATPKVPPSMKSTGPLLVSTHATPSVTHAAPSITPRSIVDHSCTESVDLFSDLSSAALFEDFSVSTDPPRFREEGPNPTVTPKLGPQSEKIVHKLTSPSARIGGTDSAPLARGEENCLRLDEEITVIAESDLDESTGDDLELDGGGNQQITSGRDGPNNTETEGGHKALTTSVCDTHLEDSFIVMHGRGQKKSRKMTEFLRSPTSVPCDVSPSVSLGSKKNAVIPPNQTSTPHNISKKSKCGTTRRPLMRVGSDSSDDEFQAPLLRRIKKCSTADLPVTPPKPSPRDPLTHGPKEENFSAHGYLEEEAELSSDGHFEGSSDEEMELDSNDYDCDDSFINDASLLTQVSPTQHPAGTTRGTCPPASMGDVYRRSLMSPDTLFAGKRRGAGNQYRMVFSQRHRLLDHYINKAGFKVAPSARESRSRKRSGLRCADLDLISSERHLFESTSSGSEAEEVIVCYGEEEGLEELPNSESAESMAFQNESPEKSPWIHTRVRSHKQKTGFLLDPNMDISEPQRDSGNRPAVHCSKRSASPIPPPLDCTAPWSEKVGERSSPVQSVPVRSTADVIISPSLLASIKVHRTPTCFSLGMEEWMDSDGEEELESVLQPDPPHLAAEDELGDILTQKELEENFDLRVDGLSDLETEEQGSHASSLQGSSSASQPRGAQEACGKISHSGSAGNSNETATPDTAGSVDTHLSARTTPSCGRTASVPTSDPSPHASGSTILVSSRAVMYSQIVSMLRYKHQLQVTQCSLSHGGYIVSNRMVAERKLHSEFMTASAGGKVLAKVGELKELFDRVCLIIEEDAVREGRRNAVPKPGHYLQHALARLIASNITVLFSQSQENTASLLARLVERERKKGHSISVSKGQQEGAQPVLQMLLKIPRVSYVTALNLCASFRTPHMLLNSSPEELKRRVPSLSLARAQGICDFFRRKYNPHLVG